MASSWSKPDVDPRDPPDFAAALERCDCEKLASPRSPVRDPSRVEAAVRLAEQVPSRPVAADSEDFSLHPFRNASAALLAVNGKLDGRGTRWTDTRQVGPFETYAFEVRAGKNGPGEWLYHCHDLMHLMEGMEGIFAVESP